MDKPIPEPADTRAEEERLAGRYERSLATGVSEEAVALGERLNELLEARHAELVYNIARLHSLLGHREKALAWLEHAGGAGFWDINRIRSEEAFTSLREQERFISVVRGIWARNYINMLEREERPEFQKPDEVMRALAFRSGERVADLGAGSGYFTLRAARAVGPAGAVWALDVVQEMLNYIRLRLDEEKVTNVHLVRVTREEPRFPDGGVDTILVIDTLHYVQDRAAFARKLRAGLTPGGRVVVIDYIPKSMEDRPWGPLPEQQVPRESIDADMAAAGFAAFRSFDFLPEQYFVVYKPAV